MDNPAVSLPLRHNTRVASPDNHNDSPAPVSKHHLTGTPLKRVVIVHEGVLLQLVTSQFMQLFYFSHQYCCLVFRVNKWHLLEKHFEENLAVTHSSPLFSMLWISISWTWIWDTDDSITCDTHMKSHIKTQLVLLTTSLCIMIPCCSWSTLVYKSTLLWNVHVYFPSFIYIYNNFKMQILFFQQSFF